MAELDEWVSREVEKKKKELENRWGCKIHKMVVLEVRRPWIDAKIVVVSPRKMTIKRFVWKATGEEKNASEV